MEAVFYISALIAILTTALAVTRMNAIYALLNLIVSLLAVAVVFFTLGAPFVAALEVIVYAGAIMVLFTFVIMMLNLGKEAGRRERQWLQPRIWILPALLTLVLFGEIVYLLAADPGVGPETAARIDPAEVGAALFGPYVLGVEMMAFLLMAGIIGAYHIGRRKKKVIHRYLKEENGTQ